jgi:hypothetical protein
MGMQKVMNKDNAIALIGLAVFAWLLLCLGDRHGTFDYLDKLRNVPTILKGHNLIFDLICDIAASRAFFKGADPYVSLKDLLLDIGVEWDVGDLITTHPPTVFLLVWPVSLLPNNLAIAAWGWLMLAVIALAFQRLGFSWRVSIGLTFLSLLWPPAIFSLTQLMPIWFLGVAYCFRGRPIGSGVAIGIASFTKLFPAILLWPFLVTRRYISIVAFVVCWGVAAAILLRVDSNIFVHFLEHTGAWKAVLRADNAAPMGVAYRSFGAAGIAVVLLLLGAFWLLTLKQQKQWEFSVALFGFFSVALNPIAWIYAPLPLLAVMIWLLRTGHLLPASIAVATFVILLLCPSWGPQSVPYIMSAILLPGVGLLLAATRIPVLAGPVLISRG